MGHLLRQILVPSLSCSVRPKRAMGGDLSSWHLLTLFPSRTKCCNPAPISWAFISRVVLTLGDQTSHPVFPQASKIHISWLPTGSTGALFISPSYSLPPSPQFSFQHSSRRGSGGGVKVSTVTSALFLSSLKLNSKGVIVLVIPTSSLPREGSLWACPSLFLSGELGGSLKKPHF